MPNRRRLVGKDKSKGAEALRKINKLKRQVGNPEYKFIKFDVSQTPAAGSPIVMSITAIGQGDTKSTRAGTIVRAKSVEIGGSVVMHASAADTKFRIMLLRDNINSDGALPGVTDLFDAIADMEAFEPHGAQDLVRDRFTIYWDKKIILDQSNGPVTRVLHFYKSLNHRVTFSGAAGTDEGPGMLYLAVCSDEATNAPTVTGHSLVRYTDV